MKKFLLFFAILILLSSCSQTNYIPQTNNVSQTIIKQYTQKCKLSSELPIFNGSYVYKSDDDCLFAYDFRAKGGLVNFGINNNTDSIIYVDLQKSFLIKNGIAYDYFHNREREKSIVAIPPCASKFFSEYSIASDRFIYTNLNYKPLGNRNDTCTFDLSNTPLKFTNFICYRVGDKGGNKFVKNSNIFGKNIAKPI